MHHGLIASYANPLLVVDGADFDGTNDHMTRGAGLSGAADSKSGIFSVWARLDGGDGATIFLLNSNGFSQFYRANTNVFIFQLVNAALSFVLDLRTSATYLAGATWLHILASWDLATPGASHLYVNDVSDKNVVTFTNDTIDYTDTNWWISLFNGSGNRFNGALAEFYFAPGQYLDFSLASNRRKFISASGKPVHLGATGSLPTGTAPIIYQHLDDGEAVANFATNRGTGGNFTITGTLDAASSSPSD